MMVISKSAYGQAYKGQDFSKVPDITLPDQSLSLQEILDRFTRNEPLPVDMGGEYSGEDDFDNPLNVDIEKLARADITEKAEYYNALEELKKRYMDQEKKVLEEEETARKKAEAERIRAEVLAENQPKP